ncbi:MAG TPA: hypothetical protein P5254_17695, partial [Aquihabitans sp.]|nr:hypothetical protein [Aquihabitans sp.]
LYQRDYLALLVKYGLEAPEQLAEANPGGLHVATEPLGLLGLGAVHAPADEPGRWAPPAAG